jgi:hypothetical protein
MLGLFEVPKPAHLAKRGADRQALRPCLQVGRRPATPRLLPSLRGRSIRQSDRANDSRSHDIMTADEHVSLRFGCHRAPVDEDTETRRRFSHFVKHEADRQAAFLPHGFTLLVNAFTATTMSRTMPIATSKLPTSVSPMPPARARPTIRQRRT